jgi:hypothetical protein
MSASRIKQQRREFADKGLERAEIRRIRRGRAHSNESGMGHGISKYVGIQTNETRQAEKRINRAGQKIIASVLSTMTPSSEKKPRRSSRSGKK